MNELLLLPIPGCGDSCGPTEDRFWNHLEYYPPCHSLAGKIKYARSDIPLGNPSLPLYETMYEYPDPNTSIAKLHANGILTETHTYIQSVNLQGFVQVNITIS